MKRYFDQSLSSRLNDETTGRILLVMQRLHEDDLAGHLLAQGGWQQLKLQARATEDMLIEVGGPSPYLFRQGELLHARRLPPEVLDAKQRQMGSAAFQAQYQQDPVPDTGNMIQRAWLRYDDQPPSRADARIVLSLDTATKTDPANDYSVCTVWVQHDGAHHLVDLWRDKVDYPALRHRVIDLWGVHSADTLLVEDQGAGTSLIQDLAAVGIPAIARKPRDSKVARLAAASSYIEGGLVWLPRAAQWLAEFESELLGFPAVRHDDQVDSDSQSWLGARSAEANGILLQLHKL